MAEAEECTGSETCPARGGDRAQRRSPRHSWVRTFSSAVMVRPLLKERGERTQLGSNLLEDSINSLNQWSNAVDLELVARVWQ